MRMNDTAKCIYEQDVSGYKPLGRKMNELGAQVTFSSVLLAEDFSERDEYPVSGWLCQNNHILYHHCYAYVYINRKKGF